MNRRSLIALGLATALARFFPIGREVDPKPTAWMDLMASQGEKRDMYAESLSALGVLKLGDVVTFDDQREVGRVVECMPEGTALRVTIAMNDGRTITARIGVPYSPDLYA